MFYSEWYGAIYFFKGSQYIKFNDTTNEKFTWTGSSAPIKGWNVTDYHAQQRGIQAACFCTIWGRCNYMFVDQEYYKITKGDKASRRQTKGNWSEIPK